MLQSDPKIKLAERELEKLARSLEHFCARARKPASDFNSFEDVKRDASKFLLEFNSGLNELHLEGIGQLLYLEQHSHELSDQIGTNLVPKAMVRFWTHIANYLAWVAFGHERAYLKQYWSGRKRNKLSNCNPTFVLPAIEAQSKTGTLSVWTDATSFLELGDILSYDPISKTRIFWEVKGLDETRAITVAPGVDESQIRDLRKELHKTEGQAKADKKIDRLSRQLRRNAQVDQLVATDSGYNPLREANVKIIDGSVKDEHYESLLEPEFRKARMEGYALAFIDACLWIGIYYNLDPKLSFAFAGSAACVFAENPDLLTPSYIEIIRSETINYVYACDFPLAQPCFLTKLPNDVVADIITGRAIVRFAFDWHEFARMIEELGYHFKWEKPDQDDSAGKGSLVLTRGVPTIYSDDGRTLHIGSPLYLRIFSDFIRPPIFALQIVSILEEIDISTIYTNGY